MSTWKRRGAALLTGFVMASGLAVILEPWAEWETLLPESDPGEPIGRFDPSEVPTDEWASSPEGLDFLEAAFRYQFRNNDLNPKAVEESAFVFLALEGRDGLVDVPPALVARFEDDLNFAPVSEADFSGFGIKHRDRKGRCVLFSVDHVRLVDDSTIEVDICYVGGCSSGNSYRFERRNGEWVKVSGGARYIT